ncbi:MAG: TlpA family protein disulfide reductase, partial [Burkholderiaceae bacterium]|nr:TlpA family protein disulfide reductase [Burkholderiaceae bacterium]
MPALGGKQLSLGAFKGQVVMINFWATWCGPCRKEMPLLEGIYRKYKPMGFTMIGVNVEPDSKAAEEWLAKQGPVSFPIAFDTDSKVSKLYKVNGMPNSVIIDRKGNVRLL